MEYTEQLLKAACLLGRGLLENGGEIYRVEDSMERMLTAYGVHNPQIFAIPATIIVTIEDGQGTPYTRTERIPAYSHNMQKLDSYNTLCRQVCQQLTPPEEIIEKIDKIRQMPDYSVMVQRLGYAVAAGFFCLFWGGDMVDFAVAVVAGIAARLCMEFTGRVHADFFFSNVLASAAISVIALSAFSLGLAHNVDMIIIGAIMLLVPGVAITNIMRDIIRGDVITGTIKIAEVLLTATAIAMGTGIPMAVMNLIKGGLV